MHAILREVGEELGSCELTFLDREPIDVARAGEQHAAYAACLAEQGVDVRVLPSLPGHPDAVFVQDTALLLGGVAVLGSPGTPARRGEIEAMAEVLGESHELLRLPEGATLEGGDVLRIDDVLYVGQSERTNHAGLKALAHLVLTEGYRVKAVSVRGCLHLETGACSLGNERVLVNPAWVDIARFEGLECVEVDPSEPFGANLLRLPEVLVAASSAPRTNKMLRGLGYEVREVEIGELQRAEAGVTCLTLMERL